MSEKRGVKLEPGTTASAGGATACAAPLLDHVTHDTPTLQVCQQHTQPALVHVKRAAAPGRVRQGCTVWLGRRTKINGQLLAESPWANPFHDVEQSVKDGRYVSYLRTVLAHGGTPTSRGCVDDSKSSAHTEMSQSVIQQHTGPGLSLAALSGQVLGCGCKTPAARACGDDPHASMLAAVHGAEVADAFSASERQWWAPPVPLDRAHVQEERARESGCPGEVVLQLWHEHYPHNTTPLAADVLIKTTTLPTCGGIGKDDRETKTTGTKRTATSSQADGVASPLKKLKTRKRSVGSRVLRNQQTDPEGLYYEGRLWPWPSLYPTAALTTTTVKDERSGHDQNVPIALRTSLRLEDTVYLDEAGPAALALSWLWRLLQVIACQLVFSSVVVLSRLCKSLHAAAPGTDSDVLVCARTAKDKVGKPQSLIQREADSTRFPTLSFTGTHYTPTVVIFANVCAWRCTGRGALAGPMTIGAVILLPGFDVQGLHDSKILKEAEREAAYTALMDSPFVCATVVEVSSGDIDTHRMAKAWRTGMMQALNSVIASRPAGSVKYAVIDGKETVNVDGVQVTCYEKGDRTFVGIAAAATLAKVTRDRHMVSIAQQPEYAAFTHIFAHSKAYGSAEHMQLVRSGQYTPIHRQSFEPLKSYLLRHAGLPAPVLELPSS